ncbi:MAG: helix-turn-helix domain-containing protein [Streptomycetaceae bacterium]|nr:helix-turn-helix domain-containing protein [Streptomycetaceae bacterium]
MSRGYHTRWEIPDEHRVDPAYIEAGDAIAFGQAVYDRRKELGISQVELARRAQMTQPQISRLEGGGTVPTIALLHRLATALESTLAISLTGDETSVVFRANAA